MSSGKHGEGESRRESNVTAIHLAVSIGGASRLYRTANGD
jgi:hypothetical protein